MKKNYGFKIWFLLPLIFLIVSCTSSENPKVAIEKFEIHTGVNLSHWLSQSDKRGEERKAYINKVDFDTIAALGFDHVRIPLDEYHLWDSTGHKIPEAFQLLHKGIGWALEDGLRVIVDLHYIHSHNGFSTPNKLWTDTIEQEKLVKMWLQLSNELKQYPNEMLAYELLNEPEAEDPNHWNNLLKKVMSAIRSREPSRKIVIGSNQDQITLTFPDLKLPEGDTNIILSFHFYFPVVITHHRASWAVLSDYVGPVNYPGWAIDTTEYAHLPKQTVYLFRLFANRNFDKSVLEQKMMPAILFAKEKKLPLTCGEFGIYPTIPEETSFRWYRDVCSIFNKYNIAYCHWNYKADFPVVNEKLESNKGLVSILTAKNSPIP